ncbi:hypothetical protein PIB30_016025 [Stylosanthes scabra]|uniref:Aminotransferase-like plant mobile domain-containing protein n=1 Tax=Stylosanthes scabra TaxID=79078 RepID=A0ABU6Y629_9FABA|nr:hypothetical protein [Stylosanthes scabra]
MPWGECTVTLEDVAYQLGLPIDGEPVSGCLWDFENMMLEGTGRPRWDWFREMFGEPPDTPDADACTMTFSWLRSRFGVLPSHPSDEMVDTARDPQCLPGCTRVFADQPTGMSSRWQGRMICCRAGFSSGFPSFALTLSTTLSGRWPPAASTAASQEAARFDALQRVRLSTISDVGGRGGARSSHSAGGTQSPLRWHALWATRFQQLFEVVQSADPGPTADFIQWWILAAMRYLVPADRFHHFPPDEIPVEATQRQSGPQPARPDVPHVPDNKRPGGG